MKRAAVAHAMWPTVALRNLGELHMGKLFIRGGCYCNNMNPEIRQSADTIRTANRGLLHIVPDAQIQQHTGEIWSNLDPSSDESRLLAVS
jgi:hypothetical protein